MRPFWKRLFGQRPAPEPKNAPIVPLPNQPIPPNQTGPGAPWRPQHAADDMTLIDPVAKDIWAADKATAKDKPKEPGPGAPPS